jgi:hypothetical protein
MALTAFAVLLLTLSGGCEQSRASRWAKVPEPVRPSSPTAEDDDAFVGSSRSAVPSVKFTGEAAVGVSSGTQ